MLAFAQDYEQELNRKMRETWGQKKYWYFQYISYMSPIEIESNTWDRTQFVSLNPSGEVIGYLGYGVEREARYVSYLEIINFTNDNSFGLDVLAMLRDIFEKYRYNKIVFSVVIGNPIEQRYDHLIERCGGRIVGVYKEHVMLPDGKLYDKKSYEITRDDYLKHRKSRNNA